MDSWDAISGRVLWISIFVTLTTFYEESVSLRIEWSMVGSIRVSLGVAGGLGVLHLAALGLSY